MLEEPEVGWSGPVLEEAARMRQIGLRGAELRAQIQALRAELDSALHAYQDLEQELEHCSNRLFDAIHELGQEDEEESTSG